MDNLPFAYTGILLHDQGEVEIELDEPGWRSREEIPRLRAFTLKPKPGHALPSLTVDLSKTEDGKRDLVYFSRVCGKMSGPSASVPLFRLYCLGWKANVRGKVVENRVWVYPTGALVAGCADPPYVDELIEIEWRKRTAASN